MASNVSHVREVMTNSALPYIPSAGSPRSWRIRVANTGARNHSARGRTATKGFNRILQEGGAYKKAKNPAARGLPPAVKITLVPVTADRKSFSLGGGSSPSLRHTFRMTTTGPSASARHTDRPLHDFRPDMDGEDTYPWDQMRRGTESSGSRVVSHFGDVKTPLLTFIRNSDAVVGCVAWITEYEILDELAKVDTAIIVQKEDFLRPDMAAGGKWKEILHEKYARINNPWLRFNFPEPLRSMTTNSLSGIDGVRCVGNHNSEKVAASPRMHHKFLIRLRQEIVNGEVVEGLKMQDSVTLHPEAVWTGSFNFSRNAGASFENAVVVHDQAIAGSFLDEFSRVAALGEPLDWKSEWIMPEWRVGT